MTVTVGGFTPFEWVLFSIASTPTTLNTVQADASGVATATVVIPAGISSGAHTVSALGTASGAGARTTVVVGGSTAGFAAVSPVRVFDTRPTEVQGAVSVTKQKYGGGNVLRVRVTGVAGVPSSGVGSVSLNVTVVDPVGAGFVTVFPCGELPGVSSLNYVAGQTVPNAVIAPVSAGGEVCFFSNVDTHLLADVNGWFAG
ncbi:MAG: hypothetical protein RLZZ362_1732 [Actinomycetota bacterium]